MNKVLAKDYTMNIRQEPTTDSIIVGQLKKGSEIGLKGLITKEDYIWCIVDGGYIAYLDGVYLHLDDITSAYHKQEIIDWLDASLESTKAGIEQLKGML